MFAHRSYNVAPDIIDAGQGSGGGGGNITNLNMPIGSVIAYTGATAPPKWLICNGTEYPLSAYDDLFDVIGFSYGPTPSSSTLAVGQYISYATGEIGFATISNNPFLKVGTIVIPTNFRVDVGPNFNGVPIIVEYAPAIGGTGTWGGRTAIVGQGSGRGNVGFTANVNRGSFFVPDLRSANPVGVNGGTITLGQAGGNIDYQLTADNLPQHRHGVFVAGGLSSQVNGSQNRAGDPNVDLGFTTVSGETYPDTGALTPVTNSRFSLYQPYIGMNYIIHAKN